MEDLCLIQNVVQRNKSMNARNVLEKEETQKEIPVQSAMAAG
jgi:hypothetical protein